MVFSGKGNYLYHRDCIWSAFNVGTQRLASPSEGSTTAELPPVWENHEKRCLATVMWYSQCQHGGVHNLKELLLPAAIGQNSMAMLGKDLTMQKWSCSQDVSWVRGWQFFPKWTQGGQSWCNILLQSEVLPLANPQPQYEYKCNHSVLYKFNCTLEEKGMGKISVGTFHSWLKQHRPYIGICPFQSDYFDKCKEYQEEIARAWQIANRLKQSGHSTEESIREQEEAMAHYTAVFQEHKEAKLD